MCSSEELVNMALALEDNISRIINGSKQKDTQLKKEPDHVPTSKNRVLIEEIDDEYSGCLKDVNDALIPVRAHGLVTIRRLIEKRDEKVKPKQKSLKSARVKCS
jgi:hypothetical protein